MSWFLWGVYPYIVIALFFVIPIVRMVYRPFSWTTRASGFVNRETLGVASLALHWGLVLLFAGHVAGLVGGLLGREGWISFFYWVGLVGGVLALLGSLIALVRRIVVAEVRAMSQTDDYLVHLFLIPILGLALYQVLVHRLFGLAYPASSWFASLWRLSPQPELMASASTITKWHVFLALTFFAYFPFTKLVHFWSYPLNYLVRPYQAMRTLRRQVQRGWEFGLRTDRSWMVVGMVVLFAGFTGAGGLLGRARGPSGAEEAAPPETGRADARWGREELLGMPLYVSQCARCHGTSGRGDGPGAGSPTFAQPPRDLTEGRYRFVSTANGVASDEDLVRTIREGLVSAGMPAFGGLSDAQIRSLVEVLDRFWLNRPHAGPKLELPSRPPAVDLERGREIYRARCATCHGEEGRGDGPGAAALPVPPADLASGRLKAGSDPEDLYWRIAAGIVPAGMPPLAAGLSVEELWSLIEYLRTEILSPQTPAR